MRAVSVHDMAYQAYKILAQKGPKSKSLLAAIKATKKPWIWCGTHVGFVATDETAFYSKVLASDNLPILPVYPK